jgi:hypothetical protein
MIPPNANRRRRQTQAEQHVHGPALAVMEFASRARLIVSRAPAVPPMIALSVQMARCCSIILVFPSMEMVSVQGPI